MSFYSPDINLGTLLTRVHSGEIQLPDFQRSWKWDTDRIEGLLASISLGYPVGVVMMLEVGGEHVNFLPRPISGAPVSGIVPDQLVLDGQQRLTSLYQSLKSGEVVDTSDARGKKLKRWYYLDIDKCLDPNFDREDAIIAVPESRVVKENFNRDVKDDYSTRLLECEAGVFPLSLIFKQSELMNWYGMYTSGDPVRVEKMNRFTEEVLNNFVFYTVPVIILKKETPKEAVCTVFEKVNTGGVVLTVFELLTATFASDNFRLADDWKQRAERLKEHAVLRDVEGVDFLQIISLLTTRSRRESHLEAGNDASNAPGIGCKRKDVLKLTLDDYKKWADAAEAGLLAAAEFLSFEKIFRAKDLPYRTHLIPLATLYAILSNSGKTQGASQLMRRWYWSGVLGELYGGSSETRFVLDVTDVPPWIMSQGAEDKTPRTIQASNFAPNRLLTLRTRNSAAYKGIYALLMGNAQDWVRRQDISLSTFHIQSIDIHHIFPHAWCEASGIDQGRRESIVNKTAIAASTNRMIGGKAPSVYMPKVDAAAQISSGEMNLLLSDHLVNAEFLRADDFDSFFADRSEKLLQLIENATGTPINREAARQFDEAEAFEIEDLDPMQDFEEAYLDVE